MSDVADGTQAVPITLTVNGREHRLTVEPRKLLADVLRQDLKLTGLNIGCAHGVCGSCTVLLNGQTARSCVLFGVQADGAEITTIEGVAPSLEELHPVQEAFWEQQGLQCGYCTPGMVLRTIELLRENPDPTREEVREGIASNLCRCTGYQFIVDAVMDAAQRLRAGEAADPQGDDSARARADKAQGAEHLTPESANGEATHVPASHP
jgi:aerobic carbon-monoxide dehydrogenase small subunit